MIRQSETPQFISVTTLNKLIKYKLEGESDLHGLYVKGEISNWKIYKSGVFFDLKDTDDSVISCILWGNYAARLNFIPKDGDEVIAFGNITVYAARGRYSLQVFQLDLHGFGAALIALENLKKKLAKEGLFDESRKRDIPKMPNTIGIIVGKNSAAESDLRRNISRRWPIAKMIFFYAQVQGVDAPKSLINALNEANEAKLDTLIVARGGGSNEDLSAFNDETLVRAFSKCICPFISAVGHEIDTTLIDYVADLRVSTPTAAAEAATPDQNEIRNYLIDSEKEINDSINEKIKSLRDKIDSLAQRNFFINPASIYEDAKEDLSAVEQRLCSSMKHKIEVLELKTDNYRKRLNAINPNNVVSRGFSITTDETGKPITSVKQIKDGQVIKTKLKDGIITSATLKGEI